MYITAHASRRGGKTAIKLLSLIVLVHMSIGCVSTFNGFSRPKTGTEIDVMSLNIHYYVPGNDDTDWENRKHAVSASILDMNPDILLFQEMETFDWEVWQEANIPAGNVQLDWVQETVQGYSVGAYGNDPRVFPITQPILYKSDRFEQVEQGFFYFSDEPDVIYSEPWSGQWPSYTTWTRLYDRLTEAQYFVVNTHLNAFSSLDKTNGVKLILERIEDLSRGDSVIIGGDFNVFMSDFRLQKFLDAGFRNVENSGSSFHFSSGVHLYPAIDHYFLSRDWEVIEGGVLQKQWEDDYPSDHHPIFARIRL